MSLEIEKKYRLSSTERDRIAESLAEFGAEFIGREFEENTIFSNDGLRERGAVVRIRNVGDRTILTYKRRVESEFDVKTQIEHETDVSDGSKTAAILDELGLRPHLVYEKFRSTWKFRSVEVVIDELPFGLFMEIEGAVTAIKEAELLLDIENLAVEHNTYPTLTGQHGKRVNDVIEARFDQPVDGVS
jgi:adenylate cyclase, class 2